MQNISEYTILQFIIPRIISNNLFSRILWGKIWKELINLLIFSKARSCIGSGVRISLSPVCILHNYYVKLMILKDWFLFYLVNYLMTHFQYQGQYDTIIRTYENGILFFFGLNLVFITVTYKVFFLDCVMGRFN